MAKPTKPAAKKPHATAATKAKAAAAKTVKPKKAAPAKKAAKPAGGLTDKLNKQMLVLKRKIAAEPALQKKLAGAKTAAQFGKKLIALGAEHGVNFDENHLLAFAARRQGLIGGEPTPTPQPSTSDCGPSYTGSTSTCNPYSSCCASSPNQPR